MKNLSNHVNQKAEPLLQSMPSAASGYDSVLPSYPTAWRDYSGQSEMLAKCHAINSTINALTRMDTWHSVAERSNNNILEAASWNKVLNRHTKDVFPSDLWKKTVNLAVSRCLSHTLRSSWTLRPIWRTRKCLANFNFYLECNAFWISLILSEQAISKIPLRVFESLKLTLRKRTKYNFVTLWSKIWNFKSLSVDQLVSPLTLRMNIEIIMLYYHKILKWC